MSKRYGKKRSPSERRRRARELKGITLGEQKKKMHRTRTEIIHRQAKKRGLSIAAVRREKDKETSSEIWERSWRIIQLEHEKVPLDMGFMEKRYPKPGLDWHDRVRGLIHSFSVDDYYDRLSTVGKGFFAHYLRMRSAKLIGVEHDLMETCWDEALVAQIDYLADQFQRSIERVLYEVRLNGRDAWNNEKKKIFDQLEKMGKEFGVEVEVLKLTRMVQLYAIGDKLDYDKIGLTEPTYLVKSDDGLGTKVTEEALIELSVLYSRVYELRLLKYRVDESLTWKLLTKAVMKNKELFTIHEDWIRDDVKASRWSREARMNVLYGEFEAEHCGKIRARTVQLASKILELLRDWNKRKAPKYGDEYDKGLLLLSLSLPDVHRSVSLDQSLSAMIVEKEMNASGYPWASKKGLTLPDTTRDRVGLPYLLDKFTDWDNETCEKMEVARSCVLQELESAYSRSETRLRMVKEGRLMSIVNLPGLRTEAGMSGEKRWKQRLVWNVPLDELVVEHNYFSELMNACKTTDCTFGSSWKASLVDKRREEKLLIPKIHEIIKNAKVNNTECWSIDFTAFDQSVNGEIIRDVIEVLSKHVGMTDEEKHYFQYACSSSPMLAFPRPINRNGGIASGSYVTNFLDSLITALYCEIVGLVHGCSVDYVVDGDDVILSGQGVTMKGLQRAADILGLDMSIEKQWRDKTHFLFNKKVYGLEYSDGVVMLHRNFNSLIRHDKEKRHLPEFEDLRAFYDGLKEITHNSQREAYLAWLLDRLPTGVRIWVNPLNHPGVVLPEVTGRRRYEHIEFTSTAKSIEEYSTEWFFRQLCDLERIQEVDGNDK